MTMNSDHYEAIIEMLKNTKNIRIYRYSNKVDVITEQKLLDKQRNAIAYYDLPFYNILLDREVNNILPKLHIVMITDDILLTKTDTLEIVLTEIHNNTQSVKIDVICIKQKEIAVNLEPLQKKIYYMSMSNMKRIWSLIGLEVEEEPSRRRLNKEIIDEIFNDLKKKVDKSRSSEKYKEIVKRMRLHENEMNEYEKLKYYVVCNRLQIKSRDTTEVIFKILRQDKESYKQKDDILKLCHVKNKKLNKLTQELNNRVVNWKNLDYINKYADIKEIKDRMDKLITIRTHLHIDMKTEIECFKKKVSDIVKDVCRIENKQVKERFIEKGYKTKLEMIEKLYVLVYEKTLDGVRQDYVKETLEYHVNVCMRLNGIYPSESRITRYINSTELSEIRELSIELKLKNQYVIRKLKARWKKGFVRHYKEKIDLLRVR